MEQVNGIMPNYSNNTKRSWMAVDLGKGRKLIPSRYCVRCVICPCVSLFICVYVSVCLSVFLYVHLSIGPLVCLCPVYLSLWHIIGQRLKIVGYEKPSSVVRTLYAFNQYVLHIQLSKEHSFRISCSFSEKRK